MIICEKCNHYASSNEEKICWPLGKWNMQIIFNFNDCWLGFTFEEVSIVNKDFSVSWVYIFEILLKNILMFII